MAEGEDKALQDLVARAEQAKALSDGITLLTTYDHEKQNEQVSLRSRFDLRSRGAGYPSDMEVMSLVEIGRQSKLTQLRKDLTSLLGTVLVVDEPGAPASKETEIQD